MKFTAQSTHIDNVKSECIIVGVYTDNQLSESAKSLQKLSHIKLKALYQQHDLSGHVGQTVMLYQPTKNIQKAILVGLGDKSSITSDSYRKAIKGAAKILVKQSIKKADWFLDELSVKRFSAEKKAHICAEAITAANYQSTSCKSDKKKPKTITVNYHTEKKADAKKGLLSGASVGRGTNLARELGNLPGNICTPTYLAKQATGLAKTHSNITAKSLSEKQMSALGMGSLLSVSAGSKEPAKLIIMEYKGAAKSQKPHVLVGKGITFDTGGISLKPGAAMDEMKFDMCGAASVFGTMQAIAELSPKINVVAIVAAAENMPSSTATKPGDIVTSMSGKYIEILNTDAEGRLVLCDALTYAEKYQPQSVVDIATLTGACVIALGAHATGLFSNNDDLAKELLDAGNATDDKAWQMPLWDDYKKQLKSNFADLANIGGRSAGSITAACFLSHFTEKYAWAHLDIAGTAWLSGGSKGATGRPVPLLTEYLLSKA